MNSFIFAKTIRRKCSNLFVCCLSLSVHNAGATESSALSGASENSALSGASANADQVTEADPASAGGASASERADFTSGSAALDASFDAESSETDTVLSGKIEHSLKLPPVSTWKKGSRFDASKLPAPATESLIWWQVPNWLIGSWKNAGKLKRIHFKDLANPDSREGFDSFQVNYPDSEVIGYQSDSQGGIWTCVPAPYIGRTEQNGRVNISIIHAASPLDVSPKQVVIKFLATTIMVDKQSSKIISVSQRESLQTYRPISSGKVLVLASMQYYDENGSARFESKVLGQSRLEEPFRETPYLPLPAKSPTLLDLRMSFDKFLRSKQLEYLIPYRIPLPPVRGYKMIVL